MRLRVLTGFPKARERAAERKRSRSEADTGRRTGLGFGLCLFFGRENRLRFSLRAGPRMGLWVGFGFWAVLWAELLRLYEPPGLRQGIFDARAGRRSPKPTELERCWCRNCCDL